jgi:DNA primase
VPDASGVKKDLALYYLISPSDAGFHHKAVDPDACPEEAENSASISTRPDAAEFREHHFIVDKKSGKPEPYITLSTSDAIVELAQISVLELHPWGSSNQSLEQPDIIVFDLDPDEAIPWETLASSALEVRKRLNDRGLQSFIKSTERACVVAPIHPEHPWPTVKQFTHDLSGR